MKKCIKNFSDKLMKIVFSIALILSNFVGIGISNVSAMQYTKGEVIDPVNSVGSISRYGDVLLTKTVSPTDTLGIYDVSMLSAMPNVKIYMPKNDIEAIGLFNYAFNHLDSPTVIRYPRASFTKGDYDYDFECTPNWEQIKKGTKGNVISYGPDVERISNIDLDINVYNARSIKPIDLDSLKNIFENELPIFVIEQVVSSGTLYDKVLNVKEEFDYKSKVYKISFEPDTIVTFGKISEVLAQYGLSDDEIKNYIESKIK